MSRSRPPHAASSARDALAWPGAQVVAATGAALGRVDHVYVDRDSGRPTFAAVSLRGPSAKVPLLPVELLHAEGRALQADVGADTLAAAPEGNGHGVLEPTEEDSVRVHYGLG